MRRGSPLTRQVLAEARYGARPARRLGCGVRVAARFARHSRRKFTPGMQQGSNKRRRPATRAGPNRARTNETLPFGSEPTKTPLSASPVSASRNPSPRPRSSPAPARRRRCSARQAPESGFCPARSRSRSREAPRGATSSGWRAPARRGATTRRAVIRGRRCARACQQKRDLRLALTASGAERRSRSAAHRRASRAGAPGAYSVALRRACSSAGRELSTVERCVARGKL